MNNYTYCWNKPMHLLDSLSTVPSLFTNLPAAPAYVALMAVLLEVNTNDESCDDF
ncbi:MAG: hypothetical protein ACK5LL_14860 [Suipraeoptans sp.]